MICLPLLLATLFLHLHVQPTHAFFRLTTKPLVEERADPVTAPGHVSPHVHTVSGGYNFGTTLTYELLRQSKCTSSGVAQDLSAYWTPMVYFWHKNGSFIAPNPAGQQIVVYYKYDVNEQNEPFPDGFRMIAGQPMARSYDPPAGVEEYTFYDCLDVAGNSVSKEFPKKQCSFGVRMNVFFPRCGDGRIQSSDRTHVMYRKKGGQCPSTHPHLHPLLHYELYFSNVEDPSNDIVWGNAMNPMQPFVLSNGDPTGYGAHGDFFNGWDADLLGQALKTCTGAMGTNLGDGRPETCPLLTVVDQACRKEGNSADLSNGERVLGWLPKLPGCNPITYTEADAKANAAKKCDDQPAAASPPLNEHASTEGSPPAGDKQVPPSPDGEEYPVIAPPSNNDKEKVPVSEGKDADPVASSVSSVMPSATSKTGEELRPDDKAIPQPTLQTSTERGARKPANSGTCRTGVATFTRTVTERSLPTGQRRSRKHKKSRSMRI